MNYVSVTMGAISHMKSLPFANVLHWSMWHSAVKRNCKGWRREIILWYRDLLTYLDTSQSVLAVIGLNFFRCGCLLSMVITCEPTSIQLSECEGWSAQQKNGMWSVIVTKPMLLQPSFSAKVILLFLFCIVLFWSNCFFFCFVFFA